MNRGDLPLDAPVTMPTLPSSILKPPPPPRFVDATRLGCGLDMIEVEYAAGSLRRGKMRTMIAEGEMVDKETLDVGLWRG